jgi:RsiW-degrading membrane proteinase PrsW (M82 family)
LTLDGGEEPRIEVQQAEPRSYQYVLTILLAFVGGGLGIIGALVQESQSLNFLLLPIIAAPIIEEALKPIGVWIALIRWPQVLRSQLFTALLSAIGGLVFGVIESAVYVLVYVSDPPDWFITYRFSVTLGLHATCSYIVGLGINYKVIDWAQGRSPLPKSSRNYYIAACVIHGVYNLTAMILSIAGVFDVE